MKYLLILTALLLFQCSNTNKKSLPGAVNGRLLITRDMLQKKKPIDIRGEWEFYWCHHYSYKELNGNRPPHPDTIIKLPRSWAGMKINGRKLPREGFATLRLRVTIDSLINEPLAFKITRWSNPLNLFVNDELITSVGVPGVSAETEHYDSYPHIADFKPSSKSFDLIVQVSNFHGKKASCIYPLQIGYEKTLRQQRASLIAGLMIIFGGIFIIGACLILAYFNTKPGHNAILFLGLSCISISLRSLFTGEALFNDLFPLFPAFIKFKIDLSLLYSFVIFVTLYGREIFPVELKLWFVRTIWIPHAVFIAVVLIFNYDIALITQLPHHLVTLFDGCFTLMALGRAVEIRRKSAIIFMSSLAVFFLSAIHDMLVFHDILETPYLLHFGFLCFIIIQTLLVTYLYTRSTKNTSILTEKLNRTSKELELLKTESGKAEKIDIEPFFEHYKITTREKEVILLLMDGASNNEIAENLFISFHTVRRHLNNIYRKCNISERNDFLKMIKEFDPKNFVL